MGSLGLRTEFEQHQFPCGACFLLQRFFFCGLSPTVLGRPGVRGRLGGRTGPRTSPSRPSTLRARTATTSLPSPTLAPTPLGCLATFCFTNCVKHGGLGLVSHHLCCSGLLPNLTHLHTGYQRSWLQHFPFFFFLSQFSPSTQEKNYLSTQEKNYYNEHSCCGLNVCVSLPKFIC